MKDKYGYFLAVAAIIIFGVSALSLVYGSGTADAKTAVVTSSTTNVDTVKPDENDGSRFHIKDSCNLISRTAIYVIVDGETGVEYAIVFGNGGGIYPLYNQDGTLRIDEQFLEEVS